MASPSSYKLLAMRFFKKECDESNPCAACLASHTSVLQVPCTRIDIKDLGYFMGTNNFQTSISILDAPEETEDSYKLYGIDEVLQISHGFGYSLPISLGRSHGKAGPVKLSWVEFCHDKLQSRGINVMHSCGYQVDLCRTLRLRRTTLRMQDLD